MPTEDARVKLVPKWSDIFGSSTWRASNSDSESPEKERPQQLVIKDHPAT